jgi:hypothetical protein
MSSEGYINNRASVGLTAVGQVIYFRLVCFFLLLTSSTQQFHRNAILQDRRLN